MRIDVKECARLLLEQDDILILTHAHPDGDTLGCGFALCRALLQKGKFAYVKNEADIPPKYNYLFDDIVPMKFTPRFVVAVDVATEGLLGAIQGKYHIDLCIDHHGLCGSAAAGRRCRCCQRDHLQGDPGDGRAPG